MNLIFDFDGTLIDSFDCAFEKLNLLADEFNYKKVAQNELSYLRNLSSLDFVKYLQIPIYKIPKVIFKARQLVREELPNLPSFVGLPDALQELYNRQITMGIVTSNSAENVKTWLLRQNLSHIFSFIHIESNFFGKARILKKLIAKNKFLRNETFYIGDETRDIDAAKKCGINSVAVTWGFNAEKILREQQPNFVLHKPEELLLLD